MSKYLILDFSKRYCITENEVLKSAIFKEVFEKYLHQLINRNDELIDYYLQISSNYSDLIIEVFKLLLVFDYQDLIDQNLANYHLILANRFLLLQLVEGFYDYWRSLERYAMVRNQTNNRGFQNVNFMEATNNFANIILRLYRTICQNIRGEKQNIYRQLPAGVNAGGIITFLKNKLPSSYHQLNHIPFLTEITLRPPFIVYPHKNTRSGVFQEISPDQNDLLKLDYHNFYSFPAKIGEYLAFVYFHSDFIHHGISLCNLFELATPQEVITKKVDLLCLFGVNDPKRIGFYHDHAHDLEVGIVGRNQDFDYFGYMKKMLLTLHNLKKIKQNCLPIHGAMVHLVLKDGTKKNIILVGDSGAGKSETIAAFSDLSRNYVKEIKVIFDDMGSLMIKDDQIIAYGTETGAFVRLDDLESGYSYLQMDRAIYMNPDKVNSRFIIPISMYQDIVRGYPVDLILYANNYQEETNKIKLFDNYQDALAVFRQGRRQDKGTTSEKGIVDSYFANPFGPAQKQELVDQLLVTYFKHFFDHNTKVGQIYTQLGLLGHTTTGPLTAAQALLDWILNN